jgi:hypothetical protein
MDLVDGDDMARLRSQRLRDPASVFNHTARPIAGSRAGIEAAIDTFGYAACAGEKAVPDARSGKTVQHRGPDRLRSNSFKH